MRLLILILFCNLSFGQNSCPPIFACSDVSNTPNGAGTGGQFGEINAGTDGCLSGEHNSTWITITILNSGTLLFTINPTTNSNDFDFAIWGPNSGCPPTGAPIRCSYAVGNTNFAGPGDNGNTGINSTFNSTHPLANENDNSEGAGGNGWVNDINVLAGESYLILVDNFTTNNGFNITFGGTSVLDCNILPIDLVEFKVYTLSNKNILEWTTMSESNNDYFILEHSQNGYDWSEITRIDGAGNSSSELNYSYVVEFENRINYYRLTQVDFDGTYDVFDLISINNSSNKVVIKITDFLGQEVDEFYTDLRIIHYSDGTTEKRVGP